MISDQFQVGRKTRVLFEHVQQIIRARAWGPNPASGQIFRNGDPGCASCTDTVLTFVPAGASLLSFFEFSFNIGLPVHKNGLYLRVIIIKTFSIAIRIPTGTATQWKSGERNETFVVSHHGSSVCIS